MTHDELVHRAAMWLKHTIGCGVVLSEHAAGEAHWTFAEVADHWEHGARR